MAKYRLLSIDELKHFETEFIDYLVVNGIDADGWVKLKNEQPKDAQKVLELFSDVVFEKVLRNTEYIMQSFGHKKFCFFYGEEKAELMIVEYLGEEALTNDNSKQLVERMEEESGMFKISYQTKAYIKERESELFDMIQAGCQIVESEIFLALKEIYLKQSN